MVNALQLRLGAPVTMKLEHILATSLVWLMMLSAHAQPAPSAQSEFGVLRTDRVTVTTGENTHLNCSVIGSGESAQMTCESHTGGGIPLVYHVALVVGANHVGYVISCGGGLISRIGCQPLSAGQVLKGSIDGDKLRVPSGSKTRTYRIETSTYIGPLTRPASDEASPATSTQAEPSIKVAAQTSAKSDPADQTEGANNAASVMISSQPTGADIFVDGNFMGNTPSAVKVPAGSHEVRIVATGKAPWIRTVTLTAGGKVSLQAVLSEQK